VPLPKEGLANGQSRAAVREADLDDHLRLFGDEQVSKDIAVPVGQSHPFEVTVGSSAHGADLRKPASGGANGAEKLRVA
jgi:hypothetical protein